MNYITDVMSAFKDAAIKSLEVGQDEDEKVLLQ
jgi:hypothetical protein